MTQTPEPVTAQIMRPAGSPGTTLVEVIDVAKSFGGIPAIKNASMGIRSHEILALVGENGAGKSTLMKVLSGIYPSGTFEGDLIMQGQPVKFADVQAAEKAGVVLVPQELRIAPALSVAENMFIGHLPSRSGRVDFNSLEDLSKQWLSLFDMNIDPFQPAGTLSTSEQRMIMIAGALSNEASVLLLDEPTAALTDAEAQTLFSHLLRLREQGLGIVLITHRLDEVEQIADRVVVMRNGEVVDHLDSAKGNRKEIVRAMIGRDLENVPRRTDNSEGEVVLHIKDLRVEDPLVQGKLRVDGVELTLRKGEVHGLYGLVGAGRTETARALFGDWPGRVEGEVSILGHNDFPKSPRDAISRGIAMLTEDRKATGIIEGHDLSVNISAASLERVSRWGIIDQNKELERNAGLLNQLDVRPADLSMHVGSLSGGNQQKVLFGRWLATHPDILILDEPTLGVDIGARFQIYQTINKLARNGLAVLLISSDVDEVSHECDRVTVMYKGRVVQEFTDSRARNDLVAAATGGTS